MFGCFKLKKVVLNKGILDIDHQSPRMEKVKKFRLSTSINVLVYMYQLSTGWLAFFFLPIYNCTLKMVMLNLHVQ